MLDHQDKHMMKAQVHVSKSSAIFDVQPLSKRKHFCQIYQMIKHMLRRRLLASFQDREHEGGDTISQGDIKDKDIKIYIQDYRRVNDQSKEFPRARLQVSRKILMINYGVQNKKIKINYEKKAIDAFVADDFKPIRYDPDQKIEMKMVV
nr:bifunctional dihydrofolate reductase-thymidylate synthase 1-like [Tanacetum cinerariifolium]